MEFVFLGQGSLSGCLQHYKHGGYRDLSDYQFVAAEDVPPDFELACPICCETFGSEEEMLQHAFEKIHHIAPRSVWHPDATISVVEAIYLDENSDLKNIFFQWILSKVYPDG